MQIVFSEHALLKIRQRVLSKEKILETIDSPHFVQPSYGGREEWYRDFGKNHLKVVIMKENNIVVVVTAHWIARVKRK